MALPKKKFSFKSLKNISRSFKFVTKNASINVFLVFTLIIFSFFLGLLTNKVIYLEQQVKNTATTTATAAQPAAPAPQPTISIDKIKDLFDSSKHIVLGDKNNKNLIVEVADPSCPYCHAAGGVDPELNKAMGSQFTLPSEGGTYDAPVQEIKKLVDQGKAAFVYIYFPGHGNGEMGTKALYCANDQDKFWEVHDKLMSQAGYQIMNGYDAAQQATTGPIVKNDKTKSQDLVDFLADTGVDTNALKNCIDSGKYDTRLTDDVAVATSLGVNGTPGFFINEQPFTGAYSWKDMASAVK